jgi:histidyl-tRNA synthetase
MPKESLQPLSGFRDYLAPTKDRVIEAIRKTFNAYGYQYLETPSIERQEILLGKLGEDGQKQLYLFEDNGSRPVGLRYDLTVPLARYVAGNLNELALPFKRYEIGNVWRGERAQKGRLRQFTQADIDIVGDVSLSAERELLQVMAQIDKELSLGLTCLLNDRRLADALLDEIKVPQEKRAKFLLTIDKAKKISEEDLGKELAGLGLSDNQLKQVRMTFLVDDEKGLEKLPVANELKKPLEDLVKLAESLGLKAKVDLGMVRGLEYYTGTIIEAITEDFSSSLVGGGRYDDLVEQLIGQKVPAVGISFGVDRLTDLLDTRQKASDEILFFACLPETEAELRQWAQELRKNGRKVEIYLDSATDLSKQLKYAAKRKFERVFLPFVKEWKAGLVLERNLETGNQQTVERKDI